MRRFKKGYAAFAAILLALAIAPMYAYATETADDDYCPENYTYDEETGEYQYGPHEPGEWVVEEGETCLDHDTKTLNCKYCDEELKTEELETYGDHSWYEDEEATIFSPATEVCFDCDKVRTVGKKKSMSSTDKAVVKAADNWFSAVKKCDQSKMFKLLDDPYEYIFGTGTACTNAKALNKKYFKYEYAGIDYANKKKEATLTVKVTYPSLQSAYEKASAAYAKWYKKSGNALVKKYSKSFAKQRNAKIKAALKKNPRMNEAQYANIVGSVQLAHNKKLAAALDKQLSSFIKKNVKTSKAKLVTEEVEMTLVSTKSGWKVDAWGNCGGGRILDYVLCDYGSAFSKVVESYKLSVFTVAPSRATVI